MYSGNSKRETKGDKERLRWTDLAEGAKIARIHSSKRLHHKPNTKKCKNRGTKENLRKDPQVCKEDSW